MSLVPPVPATAPAKPDAANPAQNPFLAAVRAIGGNPAAPATPPAVPPATGAVAPNSPSPAPVVGAPASSQPGATVPPAATTPAEPQPAQDAVSSKILSLVQKDREVSAKLQELSAAQARVKAFEDAKAKAESDPLAFVGTLGLDQRKFLDGYTRALLNDGKPTVEGAVESLQDRLDRIEKEGRDRDAADAKKAQESAVANFMGDISRHVASKKDDFALLSDEGPVGIGMVEGVIRRHFHETGEGLDIDSAARLVESHLEEVWKKRAANPKLQRLLQAPVPPTPPQPAAQAAPTAAPAKTPQPAASPAPTLNAQMAPSTQPLPPQGQLSESERIARAASLLRFKP